MSFKQQLKYLVATLLLAVVVVTGACQANHEQAGSGQPHQHNAASAPPSAQSAAAVSINKTPPSGPAPAGMVWIPGGTFRMGCADCEMPDALPAHLVTVDGFWMDQTPVTNAQFERFVKATGYVTIAERQPDPKDYPGAPLEMLVPGSAVFTPPPAEVSLDNHPHRH